MIILPISIGRRVALADIMIVLVHAFMIELMPLLYSLKKLLIIFWKIM